MPNSEIENLRHQSYAGKKTSHRPLRERFSVTSVSSNPSEVVSRALRRVIGGLTIQSPGIAGCCARREQPRTRSRSTINSRDRWGLPCSPPVGRSRPCHEGTISRFERAVCDLLHAEGAPHFDARDGRGL